MTAAASYKLKRKQSQMLFITCLMLLLCTKSLYAQTDSVFHAKLYNVSGFGLGLTFGEKPHVLRPKFSTNLGIKIQPFPGNFFLYPNFDFLNFGYNQLNASANDPYKLRHAISNFYMYAIALGYNRKFGHLNLYAFAGPGVGLVAEPHIIINNEANLASIRNQRNFTGTIRLGLGAEYNFGDFVMFGESGYLHNFRELQARPVNVVPFYFGLKSDISGVLKIFQKKKAVK